MDFQRHESLGSIAKTGTLLTPDHTHAPDEVARGIIDEPSQPRRFGNVWCTWRRPYAGGQIEIEPDALSPGVPSLLELLPSPPERQGEQAASIVEKNIELIASEFEKWLTEDPHLSFHQLILRWGHRTC
jgi:hypothetical protein